MATIRVELPQIAALMERLGDKAHEAASKGVLSAANRARTIMERAVLRAPPASAKGTQGATNTRHYLRSWKARREIQNGNLGLLVYTAGAPYAGVIEYGRHVGAKEPPIEPIARWAQRKLGLPYAEARKAAFAISRSIKRRGLRPRKVLTGPDTQKELIEAFQSEILFELIEAVKGLR